MTPSTTAASDIEALVRQFRVHEILNEDPSTKTIWLLGTIASSSTPVPGTTAAVLTLERAAFSSDSISNSSGPLLPSLSLSSGTLNDIYSSATGTALSPELYPDLRVALIYPALQKHIDKYRKQSRVWVRETPQVYAEITKPYIDGEPVARLQWVYNILDGTSESDRVVVADDDEENGFVVLPDFKWDGVALDSLYLVVIVRRRDIRSLRDLGSQHLPLLKNIRDKVEAAVEKTYGVGADQLRLYVHYQPSYYHFHVHVTNINFEGKGMLAGRAHLLDSVIDNIENIASDYYQKASLSFVLGSDDALWPLLANKE